MVISVPAYKEVIIRTARDLSTADRDDLIALWEICFDDTPGFIEFFFSKRYVPENIVCAESHGHIIAAMHSIPVLLKIRGSDVPSSMIAGVGTHPDHRGKGLMRQMFDFFIPVLRGRGIWCMTYHPVDFGIYRSMGHLSTSSYILCSFPRLQGMIPQILGRSPADDWSDEIRTSGGLLETLGENELHEMYRIYTGTTFRYSGMVARTYDYFKLKTQDYISSGARYIHARRSGVLKGYSVYFQQEDKILAEEMIFGSAAEARPMIDFLRSGPESIGIDLKLPPDADMKVLIPEYEPIYTASIEQNASGTTDLSSFIRALDLGRMISENLLDTFVVDVKDSFCSYNNGSFDLRGEKRISGALFSTDIGNFVRFLYGFRNASDLAENCGPGIREIAGRIDRELGCPVCRIIDEY